MKQVKMRSLKQITWDTEHGRKTILPKGRVVTLHIVNNEKAIFVPDRFPDEAELVELADFKPILKALGGEVKRVITRATSNS